MYLFQSSLFVESRLIKVINQTAWQVFDDIDWLLDFTCEALAHSDDAYFLFDFLVNKVEGSHVLKHDERALFTFVRDLFLFYHEQFLAIFLVVR